MILIVYFCICEFVYWLKVMCYSKIHTCCAFKDTGRNLQRNKNFELPNGTYSQQRSKKKDKNKKAMLCPLVSAFVEKWPEDGNSRSVWYSMRNSVVIVSYTGF